MPAWVKIHTTLPHADRPRPVDTGLIGKSNRSNGGIRQTDCDIVNWPTSQRDGYQFRYYNTVLNALSYRAYVSRAADGTSSWMNMINRGAGATAEAWDESQKSNLTYSHPWAASPAFHVPSGLFGIKPVEAGYSTFEIAPQPGSLDYGTVTVPTVKGEVGAGFAHDSAGDLAVIAQVPGNTSASVTVPVPDGTTQVFVDGDAVDVTPSGGNVALEDVTAGCHLVTLSDRGLMQERVTSNMAS